ncbi:MAG: energy-coupling factor ABC transporter ATP-binding protein [Terriglobales bacterium]
MISVLCVVTFLDGYRLEFAIFKLRDVVYRYEPGQVALNGLSLEIAGGSRVALVGANGSGKSTLLRLLDALCFPESGAISFENAELTAVRFCDPQFRYDFRRRVGLVFQNPDVQLFCPTVFDEVAFGPLQLRWPPDEVRRRVDEALESMRIAHLRQRVPHRLSGGEKKRLALASVLVLKPDVLLLDEPTSGLDPRSQSQIIDLISISGDTTMTVVTATHDLGMIEDIASTCHVMDAGAIAASGSPQEILSNLPMLEKCNLIHAHRHGHQGTLHSHPHLHRNA